MRSTTNPAQQGSGGTFLRATLFALDYSHNATYGSLGAVIGFLVWMWLSTIIVLVGAEINAEMKTSERPRHHQWRCKANDRGAYGRRDRQNENMKIER